MRRTLLLLALMACDGGEPRSERPTGETSSTDTATTTSTPTSIPVVPPTLSASCDVDEANALRARCEVEIDPPGAVQIHFEAADGSGPIRTRRGDAELGAHAIGLYFMKPERTYTWTASAVAFPEVSVSGEVVTGAPPEEAQIAGIASGVSTADAFLMLSPCRASLPIVVDAQGELLWYEEVTDGKVESLIWTEDDTLMVEAGREVYHFTWMGDELFRVTPGTETLHHDLFRKNGLNYALFRERRDLHDRLYDLDGFYVFDDTGTVLGEWYLGDHFVPPDDPDLAPGLVVVDYSHANAIFVEDGAEVVLSFRHLSAVMKVNGDLADPDFGEVLWTLVGDPDETDLTSDFVLTSTSGFSADFLRQHNVHRLSDGRYVMFDNRLAQTARVSILTVDEGLGTANIDQTWDTLQTCSFQGSAWVTAAGNPVAHCAPSRNSQEFDVGGDPYGTYSLTVTCGQGLSTYVPRAIPLTLE